VPMTAESERKARTLGFLPDGGQQRPQQGADGQAQLSASAECQRVDQAHGPDQSATAGPPSSSQPDSSTAKKMSVAEIKPTSASWSSTTGK
jgi:hypothetical protein